MIFRWSMMVHDGPRILCIFSIWSVHLEAPREISMMINRCSWYEENAMCVASSKHISDWKFAMGISRSQWRSNLRQGDMTQSHGFCPVIWPFWRSFWVFHILGRTQTSIISKQIGTGNEPFVFFANITWWYYITPPNSCHQWIESDNLMDSDGNCFCQFPIEKTICRLQQNHHQTASGHPCSYMERSPPSYIPRDPRRGDAWCSAGWFSGSIPPPLLWTYEMHHMSYVDG